MEAIMRARHLAAACAALAAVPALAQTTPTPNLMVILDSSGSMTWSLQAESAQSFSCGISGNFGVETWGDGSPQYPGIDTNGDGQANDSRLYVAKKALSAVLAASTNVTLGFMRYHQDEGVGINSGTMTGCENWYRQAGQYNPDGTPATLNYSGRNDCAYDADVLESLGAQKSDILMWIDNQENYPSNKEIRADGATPIANALRTAGRQFPAAGNCDGNYILLITDGEETCGGDPVAAAAAVFAQGIRTFVVGFGPSVSGSPTLDKVAQAGGTAQYNHGQAFFAGDPATLNTVLAQILANVHCKIPCSRDQDCPSGTLCQDGQCGPPCQVNTDCPGEVCQVGHCRPPCQKDADCPSGVCQSGGCIPPCQVNSDCPAGKQCDAGKCNQPCSGDSDCPTPEICEQGICRPPCQINTDCPSGEMCQAGHCKPPPPCGSDSDCPGGQICDAGKCHPPCQVNSDCPAGENCESGHCKAPQPCTVDSDCSGEVCVNGGCHPPCHSDPECPSGKICDKGKCQVGCNSNGQCTTGTVCNGGRCQHTCGSEMPCPTGQSCTNGVCTGTPSDPCSVITCPANTVCQQGACVGTGAGGGGGGGGGGAGSPKAKIGTGNCGGCGGPAAGWLALAGLPLLRRRRR